MKLFKENVIEPENQDVVIIHGDGKESALYAKELLIYNNLSCHDVHKICIGPSVGFSRYYYGS